jgi:tetratricopeptide (TPR) repeat protein
MVSNKKILRPIYMAENKTERRKFQEAYDLIKHFQTEEIKDWPNKEQGIYYWILGQWEYQQQQLENALVYYAKSIDFLEACPDKNPLIRSLIAMSKATSLSGKEDKALHLLIKTYETTIYEDVSVNIQITLLFQLGVQHGKLGEIYSAIYYFEKALQFSEDLDITYQSGQIYMSLGVCYLQLHEINKSKENLKNALLAFGLAKDTENLAGTHLNLGLLYGYLHVYDQATVELQTAISLYDQIGSAPIKLKCMSKLATFLYEDGEWEEAISYCNAILSEKQVDTPYSIQAYELLSDIEKEKKQLDASLKMINQAIALAEEKQADKQRLISKKIQLLRRKGRWQEALDLLDM